MVLKVPGLHKKRPLTPVPRGSAPGTFVVDPEAPKPEIRVMAYNPDNLVEVDVLNVAAIRPYMDEYAVTWVNVDGLGDAATIQQLGDLFGVHPLALEDVFNIRHRPKMEEYEDQIFVTARMALIDEQFEHEQISLFLGTNYVLTFQQFPGDCLEPIRERLRQKRGVFKSCGADYLAYAILDAVIDGYFPVLEEYGERMEALEEEILERPRQKTILTVQATKRGILSLRRSIWPQREFLNSLVRDASPLITDHTRLHLRDAHDHAMRIMDLVDTYREISAGLTDLYMSSVSNRMNDVMKVLTVMATIFIPLTFVAGIYGMNFNSDVSPWNMPELNWYWAYPVFWGVMVVIALVMLLFFRRRGWVGSGSSNSGDG
ncbi:MAG: magnesium transporter [Gemmatimonas sp. SG8_17]|nr:MAG: magnesium transporter [Gemmatimonas sp. SG8_17]